MKTTERTAVTVKGAGIRSSRKWIERTYGAEVLAEILQGVSPEAAEIFRDPLASNWFPVKLVDEVWQELEHHRREADHRPFRELMVEHGIYIAQDNLSTIYDILFIFVRTPRQLFNMMPRLWKTYFRGVEVTVDGSLLDERRGLVRARGLGALHHISPVVCGWTEVAFGKVKVRDFRVEEESYAAGRKASDEIVLHMSWG